MSGRDQGRRGAKAQTGHGRKKKKVQGVDADCGYWHILEVYQVFVHRVYVSVILRRTILNRTYGAHENLYISLFLPTHIRSY